MFLPSSSTNPSIAASPVTEKSGVKAVAEPFELHVVVAQDMEHVQRGLGR